MKINVHIERLVIDGAAHDADAVRAALTRELSQLLADAPPALAGFAVPSVRAFAPTAPMRSADALGGGIAQALHGALAGDGAPPAGTPR